jgi:hypothetical protein
MEQSAVLRSVPAPQTNPSALDDLKRASIRTRLLLQQKDFLAGFVGAIPQLTQIALRDEAGIVTPPLFRNLLLGLPLKLLDARLHAREFVRAACALNGTRIELLRARDKASVKPRQRLAWLNRDRTRHRQRSTK